ncbi:hypothetical protein D9758_017412 [Tetrapyrgos nigripes]|uniref:F-box domain-containing protein n=1 Tax=Tetrapyrgos nigripes TaxID=182062 RepID=A0A8H5C302_9AGAR|nr:hypothetical protein D9758_017412 [Tetrapyrgos nigripes]
MTLGQSARVNEMLRTFPVPAFQFSEISQYQRDAEKDMRDYSLEISQLRSRLMYLQEKQDLLKKHIERLRSLSAPIRLLPVELLSHIFVVVCEDDPILFSTGVSDWKTWHLPFTLASVCSGWRQIAINTSQLWSNLGLEYARRAGMNVRQAKVR